MKELEKIRAWHALKDQIGKIYDYKTRSVYYKAFLARACSQWGFNPEKPGQPIQNEPVELDDWEKEFVEDINDIIIFGIDVRKDKHEKEKKEAHARMLQFVEQDGKLSDIPDDIRTDTIIKLYYDCWFEHVDNIIAETDRLLGVA